ARTEGQVRIGSFRVSPQTSAAGGAARRDTPVPGPRPDAWPVRAPPRALALQPRGERARDQFADAAQEQRAHLAVEALRVLGAEREQPERAGLAERNERERAQMLLRVAEPGKERIAV